MASTELVLEIPGSTSNLGPGLDAVALALNLYCKLTFRVLDKPNANPYISFSGAIKDQENQSHADRLIYRVLNELWSNDAGLMTRTRITVDSQIPLGAGLGTSAAVTLGTLWAAQYFKDTVPTSSTILSDLSNLEGHSESLAASLYGNFVVCARSLSGNGIKVLQQEWPKQWKPVLIVPPNSLPTDVSRNVLPKRVPIGDAIENIQRTALLVAAVFRADEIAMKDALSDRLHEAARERLAPLLPRVRALLHNDPILGCVLSGGGPSVLVLVHDKHKEQIVSKLRRWCEDQKPQPGLIETEVAREGIRAIHQANHVGA